MSWMAVAAVGAAVVGGAVSNNNAKKATKAAAENNRAQIEANQVDPRIQDMLYGDGTQSLKPGVAPTWGQANEYGWQTSTNAPSDYQKNNGLLGQYTEALNKPQSEALSTYGDNMGGYLTSNVGDLGTIRSGALQQMQGIQAPQLMNVPLSEQVKLNMSGIDGGAATARGLGMSVKQPNDVGAASVNGPAQDKMDLSGSFDRIINGPLGANPYLTGAIQRGINQSQNAFTRMQDDSTQNLREYILPSVRGGAIASGQYGGSRQGIAEGRAMGDFVTEQQRAISQFGQNNTDAAVAAQAGAYESDSNRALSATQGLSGQQYGSAIASAQNQQSALNATASNQLQTNLANAQLQQQRYLAEKSQGLQAAIAQGGLTQQTNLANQGAILGVGQNNLQSQLSTNQLNSGNLTAGMAGLGGLLGNAYAGAATQDQYDLSKLSNGMGVLAPYLAKNATPTQLQPVYNNSGAATLGGALAGAQLGMQAYNSFGGGQTSSPKLGGTNYNYQPQQQSTNPGALQDLSWFKG